MKQFFAALLCLSMLLSMVACSASIAVTEESAAKTQTEEKKTAPEKKTEEELDPIVLPQGFSAGFGQTVANPGVGVGLGGYSNSETRESKRILDDLKISAVAVSDGTEVFLFYAIDFLYVSDAVLESVAKRVEKRYEGISIPIENIMINASHTHAAPAIYMKSDMPAGVANYMQTFYSAIYDATDKAMRDLAPATLLSGETRTQELNYVRRYVTLDGKTFLGNWPDPKLDPSEGKHETEADNQLQVVSFEREEKKDIVLVNWQCHTTTTGSPNKGDISADWAGAMRDAVEKKADVHCAFFQGAAGNLIPGSYIKGEKDNSEDHVKHGQEVAESVLEAMNQLKPVDGTAMKAQRFQFTATKKDGTDTSNFYINVFSIGDLAFAAVPGEFHDTLGMYVKEHSPFGRTFFCAYSNANISYVPSAAAMELGGYEPGKMRFVKGTGEAVAEKLVEMLDGLKN